MNLLEIREQFIKLSGRFDLVVDTSDYEDNGANFYINGGQQLIDQLIEPKAEKIEIPILLNASIVDLGRSTRVITTVYTVTAAGVVTKLLPRNFTTLQDYFGEDFSMVESGTPTYWCETVETLHSVVRKINIMPPTSEALTVRVIGHFITAPLSLDSASSFWSTHYPQLLLNAAMWRLETSYRNSEGARDWMNAVQAEIVLIDMDMVANEVANITQMEG